VLVADAGGKYSLLRVAGLATVDRQTGGDWRSDSASDPPCRIALRGVNQWELSPPPSTSRADGLVMEGYAEPGDVWSYDEDGVAEALTDDSPCPLPDWAQSRGIIVAGVLARRFRRYRDYNAADRYRVEFAELLGSVEKHAALYARRCVQPVGRKRL